MEEILLSLDHVDKLYYYNCRHKAEPDKIGYQSICGIGIPISNSREIRDHEIRLFGYFVS